MKLIDKIFWALVAIVTLVCILTSDASACGRCGLFGRRCKFQHHVAHVPYVAPTTTNFVFNNLFPTQFPYLLAQGGSSVYGVQTAAQAYAESPAFYMDRAARFTDRAFDLAQTGQQLFSDNSALALKVSDDIDRRHTNAQIAALAMEANRGTVQQTFSVQIQDGRMSIVQPQALTQGGQTQVGPQRLAQANNCAACHDGRGTNGAPKHIVLDGSVSIDQTTYDASSVAVISGKMPPESNLTAAQKNVVINSLRSLLAKAPIIDPLPPPAPMPPGDLE